MSLNKVFFLRNAFLRPHEMDSINSWSSEINQQVQSLAVYAGRVEDEKGVIQTCEMVRMLSEFRYLKNLYLVLDSDSLFGSTNHQKLVPGLTGLVNAKPLDGHSMNALEDNKLRQGLMDLYRAACLQRQFMKRGTCDFMRDGFPHSGSLSYRELDTVKKLNIQIVQWDRS